MADFVLEAKVVVKSDEAIAEMDRLGNETEKSMIKSVFGTLKFKQAILGLGVAAAGIFASIVAWSPSLSAAFSLIHLHIGLAAMAIGEAMAPAIQALIPFVVYFSELVQGLPEPLQAWIGLTIMFIPLMITLGAAVWAVNAGLIAMISPLIAVAAGIAAVIVVLLYWREILDGLIEFFKEIPIWLAVIAAGILFTFGLPIVLSALVIAGVIKIIEALMNWGDTMDALGEKWDDIKTNIGDFFDWLGGILTGISGAMAGMWDSMISGARDALTSIAGLVTSLFYDIFAGGVTAYNSLLGGISAVIGGMLNIVIDLINDVFNKIQNAFDKIKDFVNKIPKVNWGGVTIPTIPRFHEGGVYDSPTEGYALLKPRERVLTPTQDYAMSKGGNIGGNVTYSITIVGGNFTSAGSRRREASDFFKQLKREQQLLGNI